MSYITIAGTKYGAIGRLIAGLWMVISNGEYAVFNFNRAAGLKMCCNIFVAIAGLYVVVDASLWLYRFYKKRMA